MNSALRIFAFLLGTCSIVNGQNWKPIGPINRTGINGYNGQGAGMIKAIAFHPKYNTPDQSQGGAINKTIFAGSPYGGIWITRDDGANWSNNDPQYPNLNVDMLPGCGVKDIVVDYSNPTTLYASLCSSDFAHQLDDAPGFSLGTSNVEVILKNNQPSRGIYKYTPTTGWVAKVSYPYNSNKFVPAISISPSNPQIIFACTSDGIIKSNDGGNNWNTVLTNGVGKPFRSIVFDPSGSNEVYASGQEVYKSTDGGNNWSQISNFASSIPNNKGTTLVNIVVKSSTILYASVVYANSNDEKTRNYIFFKYNGNTWLQQAMFPKKYVWSDDRFALTLVSVSGNDYIFAGQEEVQRFNSLTQSWTTISDYGNIMHPDIHDIVFSPDNTTLCIGHDGGISLANSNIFSGIPNWTTKNTGLNIATIFSFAGAQKNPYLYLVGETDNGNSYVNNADENNFNAINWQGYEMADGGDKMINWENPNDWYDKPQMYPGRIERNTTGIPGGWTSDIFDLNFTDPNLSVYIPQNPNNDWHPHKFREYFGSSISMVLNPKNSNIIYRCGNAVLRSMDNGKNSQVLFRKSDCFDIPETDHYGATSVIAIAPSNQNYLYINHNNPYMWEPTLNLKFTNHIYKTTNALTANYKGPCIHSGILPVTSGVVCSNWTDISPPQFSNNIVISKKSTINAIAVSDKDPNIIWAGFSYNPQLPNFSVWKYDGNIWMDWGNGLPKDISITSLVYENGSNDGLYAGTDVAGVFYRNNAMNSWIPYGTNLPNAYITNMEINKTENTIRVGTKGRGIWKTNLNCLTSNFAKANCINCNNPNDFWEGKEVDLRNIYLDQSPLSIRGIDFIEILPGTAFGSNIILSSKIDSKNDPNLFYSLFIHGCKPGDGNSN